MNNYDKIQLTTVARHQNAITTHKILDIKDDQLIIRKNFRNEEICSIPIDITESYEVGEYVDVIIINHSRTCYSTKLIGHTPEKFMPANNVDIAR